MDLLKSNIKKNQIISAALLTLIVTTVLVTYVTSLFGFVGPSSEHRWDTMVDSVNSPPINPGDTINISGLLDEKAQYLNPWGYYYYFTASDSVLWVVTIMDPNNVPVFIDTGSIANAQGDIIVNPDPYTLPSSATLGTYKIRIVVWTDLLPNGETRTDTIYEKTFVVS